MTICFTAHLFFASKATEDGFAYVVASLLFLLFGGAMGIHIGKVQHEALKSTVFASSKYVPLFSLLAGLTSFVLTFLTAASLLSFTVNAGAQ